RGPEAGYLRPRAGVRGGLSAGAPGQVITSANKPTAVQSVVCRCPSRAVLLAANHNVSMPLRSTDASSCRYWMVAPGGQRIWIQQFERAALHARAGEIV